MEDVPIELAVVIVDGWDDDCSGCAGLEIKAPGRLAHVEAVPDLEGVGRSVPSSLLERDSTCRSHSPRSRRRRA